MIKALAGSLDLKWNICNIFRIIFVPGGKCEYKTNVARWYGMQLTIGANDQGVLAMANLNKTNYNIENLLNLNIDLAKGIHLGATAGVTYDRTLHS